MVVDTDGAAAHACAHATHANANARTEDADAAPYSNSKHTQINKTADTDSAHKKSYTKIAATATSVVVVPSLLSSAFFCTCLCILF